MVKNKDPSPYKGGSDLSDDEHSSPHRNPYKRLRARPSARHPHDRERVRSLPQRSTRRCGRIIVDSSETEADGDDEYDNNCNSGEEPEKLSSNRENLEDEGNAEPPSQSTRPAQSWMMNVTASRTRSSRRSTRRISSFQESEGSSHLEVTQRSYRLRRRTSEHDDVQESGDEHVNGTLETGDDSAGGSDRRDEEANIQNEDFPNDVARPDEDMYSRLKSRSSRRKERVDYRDNARPRTQRHKDDEPVSKRLRQRKSKKEEAVRPTLEEYFAKVNRRRRRRKHRHSSDSSNSSSSSSDSRGDRRGGRDLHCSFDKAEKAGHKKGFLDLQPNEVDPSITFASVGGLDMVVEKLRETVILPLVYREFYSARNISPPKGILFHGPPGTGKTLLARALVNECSTLGGQKVTFFVRKGGDLLSKWVGESERQLRKLFEQASRCQPSIIFFDEIDGLAPVRSSKTDQVHNSVVSTLLAELDGIKNRGDVIIIGATNRIDSIDPALRRPGRFDHEFAFLLPTVEGRKEIIKSHTRTWQGEEVPDVVIDDIAARTVGFSGADIKLLCAEASVCAMRRRYPQIYKSTIKYLLDYESIKVNVRDWLQAMNKVTPSSMRAVNSIITTGHPLPAAALTLLADEVSRIVEGITNMFPLTDVTDLLNEPAPKRFLIHSLYEDSGLDHYILPSVLHRFETVPVFTLSFETVVFRDAASEIGAISQVFNEAERINKLAIVLIPSANILFMGMSSQGHDFLYQRILTASSKRIFVLATAAVTRNERHEILDSETTERIDLPDSLVHLFLGRSYEVNRIPRDKRRAFFQAVLSEQALMVKIKTEADSKPLEDLPLAPPPPPRLPNPEELKRIEKREMRMLRSLRKFLREVLSKIVRNKKFSDFIQPVDPILVPDYHEIVKNPMCLEIMMKKLNDGLYLSARDFLEDIQLIRDNAIEYNPPSSTDGKVIIHYSHELVDYAYMVIENEMDSDFEEACQGISVARKDRKDAAEAVLNAVPATPVVAAAESSKCGNDATSKAVCNGVMDSEAESNGNGKRKLRHGTINGIKIRKVSPGSDGTGPSSPNRRRSGQSSLESSFQSFSQQGCDFRMNYDDNDKKLKQLHDLAADSTEGFGVNRLLDLRYQLLLVIERNAFETDKVHMLKQLKGVFGGFLGQNGISK